ncbi:unnamed protein product [Knipowitschia caucasica]|uniref:Neural proliferation differentiation and control protein 1 n=1 Tax=Knipowitschia caucasica TaxID=637954 RepID=A0AAV2J1Q0_KNICA
MLLLSNPRWASAGRAWLLLLAAVLHVTSASLKADPRCPSRIDCAKAGRRFCRVGSTECGPCLTPLVESDDGLCQTRKNKHHQKSQNVNLDLDEEIDFLRSVIEKQQLSEVNPEQKQSNRFASISIQSDFKKTKLHPAPQKETQNVQTSIQPLVTTAEPTSKPTQSFGTSVGARVGPIVAPSASNDHIIVVIVSVCVVAGTVAVILGVACAVKLQRDSQLARKVDYPALGGATVAPVKSNGPSPLDHSLAQNAQMFHYQHQKQQMLSLGKQKPEPKVVDTDVTSDEEEVGGDFTVYECPGLAPTGEMEVKNPLFDDSTLPYQRNHK